MRKLHIYAGLQALLAVVLFGLAGLCATWTKSPYFEPPATKETSVPLSDVSGTDRQLVDRVFEKLAVPLASRPPGWAIKQAGEGNLRFRLETPRSITHVFIDRGASVAKVEARPLAFSEQVVLLHRTTLDLPRHKRDVRLFLWSLYIEFSVWALWFFIITGVYLWVSTKMRRPLAFWSFASGWAVLLVTILVLR